MSNAQQFRLIVEKADDENRWPAILALPAGVAFVRCLSGGQPFVESAESIFGKELPDDAGVAVASLPGTARLMVASRGNALRIGGQPAPLVAIAQPGDVIQLDSDRAYELHVTVYDTPHLGSAGAGLAGKECAVCRTPIASPETTIYRCRCGSAAMHCEPDGPDALQCARLASTCPDCGQPIVLSEGYGFIPEGFQANGPDAEQP
jgi:hypothetical protein